jgi:hypothetical protein
MSKKNELVETKKTGVALPINYGADGYTGLEGTSKDDFAIPMLRIIQRMSPQLTKSDPNYIKGATAGMILNSAINKAYPGDEGIFVVPCSYKRSYIEFVLRENGGGFKGEHPDDTPLIRECKRDDKNRDILPNGHQLVDTRTFGVLMIEEGGVATPCVLTFSSTQGKKSQRWLTQMQALMSKEIGEYGKPLPMFAHIWKLTTQEESNDKGTWDGWVIEHVGLLHEVLGARAQDIFTQARVFAESMRSGAMRARHDDEAF